jgi:cytochrome bd-type quinol oxidase subunit 2
MIKENYDQDKPVCDNQDDFNQALRVAIKQNREDLMEEQKPWLLVYTVMWLIFMVWAILLAMQADSNRVLHLVIAILFSPLYVISHYLSKMMDNSREGESASFGFVGGATFGCGNSNSANFGMSGKGGCGCGQ